MLLPMQVLDEPGRLPLIVEAQAAAGVAVAAAVVGPVRVLDRQGVGAQEGLEVQMVHRGVGAVAVVAEAEARHAFAQFLRQFPQVAEVGRFEKLRPVFAQVRDQQAVVVGEGELVVEERCLAAEEFAFPDDFLAQEGFVEMEACRRRRARGCP